MRTNVAVSKFTIMKRWRIKGDLTTAMEVWYELETTALKKPSEREILQWSNWRPTVSQNQRLEYVNSSCVFESERCNLFCVV